MEEGSAKMIISEWESTCYLVNVYAISFSFCFVDFPKRGSGGARDQTLPSHMFLPQHLLKIHKDEIYPNHLYSVLRTQDVVI